MAIAAVFRFLVLRVFFLAGGRFLAAVFFLADLLEVRLLADLLFFAVVFFLALLPVVVASSSFGSARPSLMAPRTRRSFFSAASSDWAMTLLSPATDGMKVRKKIASLALFIRSNTTLRSGGTGEFGVLVAA